MSDGHPRSPALVFGVAAATIIAATAAAAFYCSVPWAIGAFAGVNLATLLLYGYDKAVAGGRKTRVPEKILHLLALLGGSPAALLGQRLFRHKTMKTSFRTMFWLIVVLQAAAGGAASWWWFTHRS
jgi:uncharacterized membrane protein YsdA (DUF1294 family)